MKDASRSRARPDEGVARRRGWLGRLRRSRELVRRLPRPVHTTFTAIAEGASIEPGGKMAVTRIQGVKGSLAPRPVRPCTSVPRNSRARSGKRMLRSVGSWPDAMRPTNPTRLVGHRPYDALDPTRFLLPEGVRRQGDRKPRRDAGPRVPGRRSPRQERAWRSCRRAVAGPSLLRRRPPLADLRECSCGDHLLLTALPSYIPRRAQRLDATSAPIFPSKPQTTALAALSSS